MINVAALCQQMLMQRFNVPNNINMNDPRGIVQYLLNNGMVSQDQVNRAMQMKDDLSVKQYLGIR